MRRAFSYFVGDCKEFKEKLLKWASQFDRVCYLDNNDTTAQYSTLDGILAVGVIDELFNNNDKDSFEQLSTFHKRKGDWLFGYLSYDLKNEIECLVSENKDGLQFPFMHFFQPLYVFIIKNDHVTINYRGEFSTMSEVQRLMEEILSFEIRSKEQVSPAIPIACTIAKEEYLKTVEKIKHHISIGDVYEMNFCQEFFAEQAVINPTALFLKLNTIAGAPFAAFYRFQDHYILSASPERFLKKQGSKLISQPIKGTIKRGKTINEDQVLKDRLMNDPKERSENVMIVDLVRNDLSRTARKGSVQVEELCGIYTFKQVHQLISTVCSELKENTNFIDAIKYAFPMGSMTGAPKVKAMELIEKYESSKRGVYSGAIGYITPDEDFDFNVVIRSILYNANKKYLSFMVGSAITDQSDPYMEYDECLLKAKGMFEVLAVV